MQAVLFENYLMATAIGQVHVMVFGFAQWNTLGK